MLAHLSRTSLSGVRSHASKTAKSSPSARISRPLVSGRSFWNRASFASSALKTSSSVTKAYYPIQKTTKRFHAGCGQPHGGDEIPGVGMERELRAHLNVTNLVIQDTSGTYSLKPVKRLFNSLICSLSPGIGLKSISAEEANLFC